MNKRIKILAVLIALCIMFCGSSFIPAYAEDGIILEVGDTGDEVILLQLRLKDLGYYSYKITNYYGEFTQKALLNFQDENDIRESGVLDDITYNALYSNDAKRKAVHTVVESVYKGASNSSGTNTNVTGNIVVNGNSGKAASLDGKYGAIQDWFSYVDEKFERGKIITVYAVDSGYSFQVKRYGGSKHADVEPVTADDAEKLRLAHGGSFGWARMAVIAIIDGELVAASMNAQPHSSSTLSDNNFNGHCCMHFYNSRTHGSNAVCPDHQAMVLRAAGQ